MLKVYQTSEGDDVPPECRATVVRIQTVLDGGAAPEALDADHHPVVCAACRERARAARVLLSVLSLPSDPTAVPADFSARVVKAMREDRHARTRRGVYKAAAGLALAATVFLAIFTIANPPPRETVKPLPLVPVPEETAKEQNPAPETPAPEARPIRFDEAIANTEQAIRDTPRPFIESVSAAPKVFDLLTGPFKTPVPAADPLASALVPTRKSLAEIPAAARAGLEPVTGTAEKAFARFLSDVGAVKPNS